MNESVVNCIWASSSYRVSYMYTKTSTVFTHRIHVQGVHVSWIRFQYLMIVVIYMYLCTNLTRVWIRQNNVIGVELYFLRYQNIFGNVHVWDTN